MIGLLFEDSNDITNKILKNKKIKLIEKIDYTNIEKELLNNEVNCFLKINKNEKIINLSDVDFTGSNMVCVQYGNWKNKENRLYGSFKFENKLSQDIILESSKSNKIFISEDYYLAKKNFENKEYENFARAAEKILFEKETITIEKFMLMFYLASTYLFKLNRPTDGNNYVKKMLAYHKNFHEAWCIWADALVYYKKYKQAIAAFKKTQEAFSERNPLDLFPYCEKRGAEYPAKMIIDLEEKIKNIRVIEEQILEN